MVTWLTMDGPEYLAWEERMESKRGLEFRKHGNRVWHRCPRVFDLLMRALEGEQPPPIMWPAMDDEEWDPWEECLVPMSGPIDEYPALRADRAEHALYLCPGCMRVVTRSDLERRLTKTVVRRGEALTLEREMAGQERRAAGPAPPRRVAVSHSR